MKTSIHRRLLTFFACIVLTTLSAVAQHGPHPPTKSAQTIRLALLLDTSNSMDGLIDQAKSQLWKIVNELAAARCQDGAAPVIRIALYEYGNSRLAESSGYIRMVSPLTGDLDLISEKLFALTTNGGDEYCGQVINTSLTQLNWLSASSDLNMIFIAGNEPFNQGEVSYAAACSLAKEKHVVVNSIFCGGFEEGVQTEWKRGADLTGGTYMSIEQNKKTVYIPTPYDDQIDAKNEALNKTYVYYGAKGSAFKENQVTQDRNAASYSKSNKVERAVSKSSAAYSNSTWDLVDASKENSKILGEISDKDLPAELKGLSAEQRKQFVSKKTEERVQIQKEIQALSEKRSAYISSHTPKTEGTVALEDALIKAIRTKGAEKNMKWN